MKTKFFYLSVICLSFLMFGCAAKSSRNYIPPTTQEISNSKILKAPYAKTWQALIAALSEKYFDIQHIEKDSGFITVTYTSDIDPNRFVDCGAFNFVELDPFGKVDGTYVYKPEAKETNLSMRYYDLYEQKFRSIQSTSKLHMKSNIHVTEQGKNETRITISTLYSLDITNHISGKTVTCEFSSDKSDTSTKILGSNLQCTTTYKYEQDLIKSIEVKL